MDNNTRITKELRLPIGIGPDGKTEYLAIGHVLETDYGKGNVSRDFSLNLSVLQPVLYQQVKGFAGKSAFIVLEKADFSKRYKAAADIPPESAAENDPDCGHD